MTILHQSKTQSNHNFSPLDGAAKGLKVKRALLRAGFKKERGADAYDMFMGVVNSRLIGENLWRADHSSARVILPASKSSMYRFMSRYTGNWERLAVIIGAEAVKYFKTLNDTDDTCFCLDDTLTEHCGAKAMEGCTWVHDHNDDVYRKGYNFQELVWTDGFSAVYLGGKLVCNDEKEGKKACPKAVKKEPDRRTYAHQIRVEAYQQKNDLALEQVKQAIKHGIKPRYLLEDSWYSYTPHLVAIKKLGIDVITMLKKDNRRYYTVDRKGRYKDYLDLKELGDRMMKKAEQKEARRLAKIKEAEKAADNGDAPVKLGKDAEAGNSDILGTQIVLAVNADENINDPKTNKIMLKLVFVRNRKNKNEFLVLASTRLDLTAERIVQLYGRRWTCETGFHLQKKFFGLGKESQSTSFDNQNAFANIACIRGTMVEFKRRTEEDVRGMGEIFISATEAVREIPLTMALDALMEVFDNIVDKLEQAGCIVKGKERKARSIVNQALKEWFSALTDYAQKFIEGCSCEAVKLFGLKPCKAQTA